MLLTEKDAADRLCLQVLAAKVQPGEQLGCIGSKCMAWRSVETQKGTLGYCGLAGYPPNVLQPLIGQTIVTAQMDGEALRRPGGLVVAS